MLPDFYREKLPGYIILFHEGAPTISNSVDHNLNFPVCLYKHFASAYIYTITRKKETTKFETSYFKVFFLFNYKQINYSREVEDDSQTFNHVKLHE